MREDLAAHHEELLGFVDRRVRDRALAEDLVQSTYAKALEHEDELRDERAIRAWLYRALRNAIVDRQRRRATETRALDELSHELDDRIEALDARPARVCRCVMKIAEGLKPEYAAALQQIEVDGEAVKTFAARNGITSGNAAVRIFRAREALRRGLLATCGACAKSGCSDCTCG